MLASKKFPAKKTWIEIDKRAVAQNVKAFRGLLSARTKLWAVVKSNAYGHGLFLLSKLMQSLGVDGFCVDSVIEGVKLREIGIKKFILVLGPTLSRELISQAAKHNIAITISTFEGLKMLERARTIPRVHLKIDTGMHRQGFRKEVVPEVVRYLKKEKRLHVALEGVYTHFATATDAKNTKMVAQQAKEFRDEVRAIHLAGIENFMIHAAATGATMLGEKYHFDAVRVGLGLYGLYPTPELATQFLRLRLKPVMQWRTVISEVKDLLPGECVGYDHTACVSTRTKIAVLPIGYWHGFPRALSSVGEVLIRGKRARVLGRVSMDIVVADASAARPRVGDVATIVGRDGSQQLCAEDAARAATTSHYEFVTRLNPLMERVITNNANDSK